PGPTPPTTTRSGCAARTASSCRPWDALPFDADAARAYGRVYAATRSAGRATRSRFADLMIAATAAGDALALYTRSPSDLEGPEEIVPFVAV
ncbi:MAG: VapC toxin family PIN domain ribonuclease, partial [Actinomycetota bacterium]|nr:VapC toxin family PIN domain ribonuclease [Actinomycetota bacterium]